MITSQSLTYQAAIVDWLLRVYGPIWLDACGLTSAAAKRISSPAVRSINDLRSAERNATQSDVFAAYTHIDRDTRERALLALINPQNIPIIEAYDRTDTTDITTRATLKLSMTDQTEILNDETRDALAATSAVRYLSGRFKRAALVLRADWWLVGILFASKIAANVRDVEEARVTVANTLRQIASNVRNSMS